ncbi:MAG: hypothetical protein IPJ81_15070 [Chitinophagaceae bacterium]|nr:hypothetical protein [Chitinophagaceae bacterium]
MHLTKIGLIFLLILSITVCKAQNNDSIVSVSQQIPEKYISQIADKVDDINQKLSKQTLKALRKFEQQEAKIKRKLLQKDSTAKEAFAFSTQKINELQNDFNSLPDKAVNKLNGEYNAYLDTLQSTFKFLQQGDLINKSRQLQDKLSGTSAKIDALEKKLQKAGEIKKYLKERKEFLKQQLEKFGMVKQLRKIEKTTYYYTEYIKEYKSLLTDRKKLEQKAMSLLYATPLFKKFVSENSMLASLLRLPGESSTTNPLQNIAGIQTRASVQQVMQDRIATAGPNAVQQIQQQVQDAQAELSKLKDKIAQYGSADAEIPGFKPNSQKTKGLLKRLEYGANMQFAKSNNYFPNSSDIAFSVGYKLNDKSAVGVGASYRIGLGTGWNNIKFISQGLGLRSYMDWKLKGQFYVSGGYEQNYNTAIRSIQQLNIYSAWTSSGLLGISKKYQMNKKLKGQVQLLYDFLSNQHLPKTQPVIFRFGYSIK